MENKIIVETSAGKIIAEKSHDPSAPGIGLYFIPKGTDVILDLAYSEVKEDENYRHDYESKEDVDLYIYENIYVEEYTKKISYKRRDVIEMCRANEIQIDEH